jgi:phosphatidylserine/phosphatidylglycerophosphate/cardiolipin synthase-like enzyme
MANDLTTFTSNNVSIYFQSKRTGIETDLTAKLVAFIQGTQKKLDCAIYDLRHPDILAALQSVANDSSRSLRIAYDAGKDHTGGPIADPKPSGTQQAIEDAGLSNVAQAVHNGSHLMHNKFLVRDGETVWTGSANFTIGGLQLQDNNCLVINSADLANHYTDDFEKLLQDDHHTDVLDQSQTDGLTVNATTKMSPFFSPASGEGIEDTIVSILTNAKKVRILAFLISDQGILEALLQLQQSDIKGIYDPHGMQDAKKGTHKDPALFWFTNDPRFAAAPSHAFNPATEQDFMHNKVMIVDDHFVITGSYNFSESAELNDENVLVIDSADIAAAYSAYFNALFKQYAPQNG